MCHGWLKIVLFLISFPWGSSEDLPVETHEHRTGPEDLTTIDAPGIAGVGVNIVNIFWERLSAVLGEATDDDPGVGGGEDANRTARSPRGATAEEAARRHSLAELKALGIDLVRFAASPYCPHQVW